jgi:hypothetical protein
MSHLIQSRVTRDKAILATVAVPSNPGSHVRARLIIVCAFGAVVLASLHTIPGLNAETFAAHLGCPRSPARSGLLSRILDRKRTPGLLLDLIVFGSLPLLVYVLLQRLGLDWNEWDAIREEVTRGSEMQTIPLRWPWSRWLRSLRLGGSMSPFRYGIGALAVSVIVATGSRTGLIFAVWMVIGLILKRLAKDGSFGARALIKWSPQERRH